MRNFIMPPGLLFLLIFASSLVIGVEYGIAQGNDGERVVATAHCTGKSLVAGNVLSLALTCDTNRPASTTDAATIKRYAEAPTTRLVCAVRKSGSADCAPAKRAAQ